MPRGGRVTLLWVVDGAPEQTEAVVQATSDFVELRGVRAEGLERTIAAARSRGGVVVLCAPDRHASLLKIGVDEVAPWDAADETLQRAIAQARLRADWRASTEDASHVSGLALMSAALGHELRNPLTAAIINCSTIETLVTPMVESSKSTSDLRDALTDLNLSLQSIEHVVRHMTALADPGEVGVCDLARTMVELTTSVHKEVELVADFEVEIPDSPCPIAMSRTRAIEVVASILSNAVLAVEQRRYDEGRGEITLKVSAEPNDILAIEVTDNGVGMSLSTRKRALNPFFSTRRPSALGVGLTFAALHVRRSGGEILIDSQPNEGTSVRLFFPVLEAAIATRRPTN